MSGDAMDCEYCNQPGDGDEDVSLVADPYQVGMGADPDDPEIQGWWCADCYARRQDDI